MKKLLFLFIFFCCQYALLAQCDSPQSQIDIQGNNIKARILNGGDLFTDFNKGQFIPNPNPNPGTYSPATIYAAGLWMGAVDPGGNLKLATVDYRTSSSNDYSAGPLNEDGTTDGTNCANWDRHFRVTDSEVAAFLTSLPMTQAEAIAQFPSIMGWPAVGNPYFASVWGFDLPLTYQPLAPFFDADGTGIYNPLSGDYPVVELRSLEQFLPAEIIWCVFNDQNGGAPHSNSNGKAFQAEIQLTVWAMNCSNQSVLNNTIFTSHKIIYRGAEPVDSAFIALWIDIDLGCYLDDYVGSDPTRNAIYAYNQDALDGQPGTSCNGTLTFADAPPVQTVTILNHPMNKLMYYNSNTNGAPAGTTDPAAPIEFYNYLTGAWRDGTPLTYGNSGYGASTPTDFAFPDNPEDPNGWSMCTANLAANDPRLVASCKLGQMVPGQVDELNAAWTVHFNAPPPCNLGTALGEVSILQNIYEAGFSDPCSPVLKAPEPPADSLQLFPNPTNGDAKLQYGSIQVAEIRIFDAAGKLIQTLKKLEKGETTIKTSHLPSGLYFLRLLTDQGNVTKKLTVLR